ncbi:hypothetical protein [Ktedonobacter sp. SOSP1-52]|uniref:hypothetical protein n=1 Tax=Ktedonobacter sp. SOSP1-52 TaxID=2778366 RepID=UPI0019152C39|nr:hypothetical protein [Ktedonobacter sp. SOSP1-52]
MTGRLIPAFTADWATQASMNRDGERRGDTFNRRIAKKSAVYRFWHNLGENSCVGKEPRLSLRSKERSISLNNLILHRKWARTGSFQDVHQDVQKTRKVSEEQRNNIAR